MNAQTKKSDGTWKLILLAAVVGLVGMLSLRAVQQREAYKASTDSQLSMPLPAASAPKPSK
jgi:hypothetical protein